MESIRLPRRLSTNNNENNLINKPNKPMKKELLHYEMPTIVAYTVMVEAGFATSGGNDWNNGGPGGDFDENEYPDEL